MRMASRFALSLPLVALLCAVVQAHPGHAREVVPAESSWHYLLQPEHALVSGIGIAAIAGFGTVGYLQLARRRQPQLQPVRVRRFSSN